MEIAMEVEDDVFFADLNKQISLLIMDDGDEEEEDPVVAHCPSVSLTQAFSGGMLYPTTTRTTTKVPILYDQSCRIREISKGTGVFIPRSSHPRRTTKNNKQHAPKSSSKRNSYSYSYSYYYSDNNSRLLLPPPPLHHHHYNSFNPKNC